jgi:hypothetical protein
MLRIMVIHIRRLKTKVILTTLQDSVPNAIFTNINLIGKDDRLVLYIAGCSESCPKRTIKRGGQRSKFFSLNLMERTVTSEP